VRRMLYKRHAYFRYTFGKLLEGKFRIVTNGGQESESSLDDCQLIDCSPGGAKLFEKFDIPVGRVSVRLRAKFTILENLIEIPCVIVWRKPYSGGYMYGYDFDEDAKLEQVIVEELKLRRRSKIISEIAPKEG
jgi:hypothetical protein